MASLPVSQTPPVNGERRVDLELVLPDRGWKLYKLWHPGESPERTKNKIISPRIASPPSYKGWLFFFICKENSKIFTYYL